MRAVGSIAVIALPENDGCSKIGFSYDLSGHLRFAVKPPHVSFSSLLAHVVLDRIAGYDGFAKFGLVDRQKKHRLGVHARCQDAKNTRGLSHPLDQQHARKNRIVWEMSHELRFVGRDVFDPNPGLVSLDGDDAINHQEGIAMWQCLENPGDIHRLNRRITFTHLASLPPLPDRQIDHDLKKDGPLMQSVS